MVKPALAEVLLILSGALLAPQWADAALGEPFDSLAADQSQMRASAKMTPRTYFEVHEFTLPSTTLVREYVAGGLVFAIAWNGPSMPDLRQTLGRYFAVYSAQAQSKRGGRTHLHVQNSDVIIQAGGHMRAFAGRAYLPALVPAGMATDEIQ
jgi:hypothetical protein